MTEAPTATARKAPVAAGSRSYGRDDETIDFIR